MTKRLWFISLFLLVGCSPVAKSLQVDHSIKDVINSSTSKMNDSAALRSVIDSTIFESMNKDSSHSELSVIQIIEVFDTTGKETNGAYPLYSRKTTIYSSNHSLAKKGKQSYNTRLIEKESVIENTKINDSSSSKKEVISHIQSKQKSGTSLTNKLFIRIGLLTVVAMILYVLYLCFKPRLNTIVRLFKNILKG